MDREVGLDIHVLLRIKRQLMRTYWTAQGTLLMADGLNGGETEKKGCTHTDS